jgi:S-(hydroxymethyl)glutathione dehydrogenase/alcohol dehydrogenase
MTKKMKTRAAVLEKIGEPLCIQELEIPELQSGQVLVKILYSGICHSQINEIEGRKGEDKYLPHLLGHEGSGIVEKIGQKVNKVKPGDYVVLSWIKGVGEDVFGCVYDNGRVNAGAITTFNTYAVISENRVFKIPTSVPPDVAALLGCAVPTGAGIIKNELHMKKEHSLAIFGIGGIGVSALIYACSIGAEKIFAVDINEYKLTFARTIGATHIINCLEEDAIKKIKECTNGIGVDFALECSGAKIAMEAAIASVKNTGTAIIAGNLKQGEKIAIDPFELIKGKNIRGTWGGATNPDEDILFYANKYLEDVFPIHRLVTQVYSLEKINDALQALKQGRVIRTLIKMETEEKILPFMNK